MKEKTTVLIVREKKDKTCIETSWEVIGDSPSEGMAKFIINNLLDKIRIRKIE